MIRRAAGFIGSWAQEILESGGYTSPLRRHPARRTPAYRPWKAKATKSRRVAQAPIDLLALTGAPNTRNLAYGLSCGIQAITFPSLWRMTISRPSMRLIVI